jgi:glycosyltransferase involved in cell wall biosynthesis
MVSHPIQHFAPWHAEVAKLTSMDVRVFFYASWGLSGLVDPGFGVPLKWDVPLLKGYEHEFLPGVGTDVINDTKLDNPLVGERLDAFDPDVVKVFGYSQRTTKRVADWTSLRRKPLLLYSDSNIKAQPLWKGILKRPVVGAFYRKVDAALYVGDNNRAYHSFFGIPPDRLFEGCLPVDRKRLLAAVPDPTMTKRKIREAHGIPQDAFVVLFCGKFIDRKRPLDVLRAIVTPSRRPLWALMVGEGELRRTLEAFIRTNAVSNATLTGFVNQKDIPSYYAAADILVVSSSFDPHPLIVTEASVFGLPILVSDAVGCIGELDTARTGTNAIVYPCGDVEHLRRAIVMMSDDSITYQRYSSGARKIASTQDSVTAASQLEKAALRLAELGKRTLK